MPIYEYHCKECGQDSELLMRSRDRRKGRCPECGSRSLEQKLSTFAPGGKTADTAPACSGMPSNCGRCEMG